MDIIDRYVYEVGRHLPAGLRPDVQAELRSLLTESLEERSRAAGRPADAALATDVVREFGRPRDVASRYAPHPQYLIGPALYPAYRTVVKVAVPVYAAVTLLMVVLGAFREPGRPASAAILVRATGGFLSGLLYNLGLLTLVFALVERAMHREDSRATTWDPARLPPVSDPDRISYFGRIFFLYCLAAVALLFNFYPDWVGIVSVRDGDVRVIRLLEPGFSRYLPLLNLWWTLAFALGVVVLRRGRWGTATRWAEFGLELFNAAILIAIILGPPVFQYDPLVKLVLQLFLLIVVIRAGAQLYRLFTRRPPEPWRALGTK
jgi:hypothetical protein